MPQSLMTMSLAGVPRKVYTYRAKPHEFMQLLYMDKKVHLVSQQHFDMTRTFSISLITLSPSITRPKVTHRPLKCCNNSDAAIKRISFRYNAHTYTHTHMHTYIHTHTHDRHANSPGKDLKRCRTVTRWCECHW